MWWHFEFETKYLSSVVARGFLLPGANVCVAAPLVRSAAKSSHLPLEVGPLKSSYRGSVGAL